MVKRSSNNMKSISTIDINSDDDYATKPAKMFVKVELSNDN
jgi:hypothetical protein